MRRRLILPIAIGLGISLGLLPLAAAYYLSQRRAIATERVHLKDYARWTLQRADLVVTRAKDALRRLVMENHALCSPLHLERLQQLTKDVLSVEKIDVFKDGTLVCDSWGASTSPEPMRKPDIVLSQDFGLVIGSGPTLQHPPAEMVAVAYGPYQALIKKERLIDVLYDTPMVIGIATHDGRLLALSGRTDPRLARQLSLEETSGTTGQKVFSSLRSADFIAFAISDHSVVAWRADSELWKLIPVGVAMSAGIIALIVWASRQRMSLAGELKTGIAYREFVAHYQPIIELATGRCVGAEALIRWPKPDGTWVRPDLFITYAEDHHMIAPVTDIMIARVLEDMKMALRADPSLHIAINISAEDIQSGRFLDVLSPALETAQVDPAQIWLEATERSFIEADAARATLKRARQLGHTVAIDDFGTGYSSLSLLESLPLNALKIDKSFIDAIGREAATSIVTPSIIDMAHTLTFVVVAEGVEKAEQAAYLKAAGVEFAQGWLYSKALPPGEFLRFYRQRNEGAPIPEAA